MSNEQTEKDKNEQKITSWRRFFHKFVPANFNDIIGLTKRLIFEGDKAGIMAMLYSLFGAVLTPLDMLLQPFEKRKYASSDLPKQPLIFVCGAPRSGTTLTGQVLIKHLPVFYFNNLTSLFPRSPVTALRLFGRWVNGSMYDLTYKSFYGRTTKLFYPNDALYFWDRWTEVDRKEIPQQISKAQQAEMAQFFGAVEKFSEKPLLNKNNSLNTYASLVAEVLPNAYFIS